MYRLGVSVHPASCKKGPLTIEQSNELSFRKPFRVSASVFFLVSALVIENARKFEICILALKHAKKATSEKSPLLITSKGFQTYLTNNKKGASQNLLLTSC